jgi:hypothetical protein
MINEHNVLELKCILQNLQNTLKLHGYFNFRLVNLIYHFRRTRMASFAIGYSKLIFGKANENTYVNNYLGN